MKKKQWKKACIKYTLFEKVQTEESAEGGLHPGPGLNDGSGVQALRNPSPTSSVCGVNKEVQTLDTPGGRTDSGLPRELESRHVQTVRMIFG